MNEQERVKTVEKFVCSVLKDDRTGHDLDHVFRVRHLSLYLAVHEGGNREIIELSALLHDCADPKLVSSEEEAYKRIDELLRACDVPRNDVNHIIHIIKSVSFKGGNGESPSTIEGKRGKLFKTQIDLMLLGRLELQGRLRMEGRKVIFCLKRTRLLEQR